MAGFSVRVSPAGEDGTMSRVLTDGDRYLELFLEQTSSEFIEYVIRPSVVDVSFLSSPAVEIKASACSEAFNS
jgi:hypothetical protein